MDSSFLTILTDQLLGMYEQSVRLLPQMVGGLFILFMTWLLAKGGRKIAQKLVGQTEIRPSLLSLIETVITIAIWVLGLFIAATVVLPGITPASIFAGLGIGAVAIGFAFQDIFENFLAGVLIMIRKKMQIGDVIECEGISGKVQEITLRETYIRKLSNEVTVVPNSILFKNPVEIFTDNDNRRHEVVCGVAYDVDLEEAAKVIRTAVESCDMVQKDKGIDVFACEFNSSSVDYRIRWWSGSTPRNMHESKDQVIRSVKRALDDAGIEIPFPYVTHTFKEPVPLND